MKKIKQESHTADIQILVEADSLQELFEGALEGMNGILKWDIQNISAQFSESYKINLTAPDVTVLLIDFLNEVLTHTYIKKQLFTKLKFQDLTTIRLEALIYGVGVDSFDDDIKGVTYHLAEVKKIDSDKWQTSIVFDV